MRVSRRTFVLGAAIAVSAWGMDLPRQSPDFTINLTDGSKIALKSLRSKVVVLAFISTA